MPSRWQRWLAAPQRRKLVGYCVSCFCHLVLLVILALAVSRVQSEPAHGWIHALSFEDLAAEGALADGPFVRQIPGAVGLAAQGDRPAKQGFTLGADPKPARPAIAVPREVPAKQSPAGTATAEIPSPAVGPGAKPSSKPEVLASNDKKVGGKLNRRLPGGRSEGGSLRRGHAAERRGGRARIAMARRPSAHRRKLAFQPHDRRLPATIAPIRAASPAPPPPRLWPCCRCSAPAIRTRRASIKT